MTIKRSKLPKKHVSSERYFNNISANAGTWKFISAVLGILLIISVFTNGFNLQGLSIANVLPKSNKTDVPKTNVPTTDEMVTVEFYVMSQCPYGTQVEDAIAPVLEKLGENIDFNLDFIGQDLGEGNFQSLHGQPEVNGNKVQLCAIEYNPEEYMDLIVCMNKNANLIPNNWEKCATDKGLDVESIKECYEGEEGNELLRESFLNADARQARGSPTIYIDDAQYSGGRTADDFLRAICNSFEEEKPGACSDVPEPVKLSVTVISDELCSECPNMIAQLKSTFEGLFPGVSFVDMDYEDEGAKELLEKHQIEFLPAYIFDTELEETSAWKNAQFNTALFQLVEGKYIPIPQAVGSEYDPLKEICDNGVDDRDNDGLVDCEDDECDGEFQCMDKLEKPVVEAFVMSHCPYGTQIEKGLLPVAQLLGDKIDFSIKYVNYAMHGETEVKEQLLQYCIQEEMNDKYLEYLACFLGEGDTESCLAEVGISRDDLQDCIDSTDEEFQITENLNDQSTWNGNYPPFMVYDEENQKYGVRGSPTLVVNGVVIQTARDPASLLKNICIGFADEPEECSQELSAASPSAGFGFDASSGSTATGSCS